MDQDYYNKKQNNQTFKKNEDVNDFQYLNINDTLVKPMTFQMLEKFNGSSDESVYLITYRKKPNLDSQKVEMQIPSGVGDNNDQYQIEIFNGVMPNIKCGISKHNPILKDILSQNEKVRKSRLEHEALKSKIRLYFAFGLFSEQHKKEYNYIDDQFIINSDQHFSIRNLISKDKLVNQVIDIKDIDNLESVIEENMKIKVSDYIVIDVQISYETIINYKHIIDFEVLKLQFQNDLPDDEKHIHHNSILLLVKREDMPTKFKSYLDNFDNSEPVQLKFSYKNSELNIFCQRGWDLEKVNKYFLSEIKGRLLTPKNDDPKDDKQEIRVPNEDFNLNSIYVTVNNNLVNLQTMAKTRQIHDLIYHNQEVCYIDKQGDNNVEGSNDNIIEVIFEKKYDVRTRDFEFDKKLSDILMVIEF